MNMIISVALDTFFYQVALGRWIKLIMTSSQQYIFQKLLYIFMYMPVKQS